MNTLTVLKKQKSFSSVENKSSRNKELNKNLLLPLFLEGQEPQIFNEEAQECVYIEHEGDHDYGHYSRLSKLPEEK